ncbi:hypothetical protein HYFRA_00006297 [Hymenoscyphus fraxineus]|uniref:Uncharacterized protein n=1 Tax=Hymenoscyphus fraxineus TaxID=746836 RepID=A0A9N9L950_9HELO|nr:hypothetical protein HYFRA_00006297 [Hymenoscyphus fraxineus]
MEIIDPGLGMFSLLPLEVRRMIWKHLTPNLHVGQSLPRKPNRFKPEQQILLTSRKIYAELASEVPSGYNGHIILFIVSAQYKYKYWIQAVNYKGGRTGIRWFLKDLKDATSRGFDKLPWKRLHVQIHILAPKKEDAGQVLCLNKKIVDLVQMLKQAKSFRSFSIVFECTRDASWFDNGRPQCSIDLGGYNNDYHYDYEYILPLFLQLRNAKMVDIRSNETSKIKRWKKLGMSDAFIHTRKVIMKKVMSKSEDAKIQKDLESLGIKVEEILDNLPSKTANMLRLDLFSGWYTDKLHGESPYQDKMKKLVLERRVKLAKLHQRYLMMRAHNPLSLGNKGVFPWIVERPKPEEMAAGGWNRDVWHSVYKNGIPPLNDRNMTLMYYEWERNTTAQIMAGSL